MVIESWLHPECVLSGWYAGDENSVNTPELVMYFCDNKVRLINAACGQYHTCAISDRGDVYTWGKGENGQLGQGETNLGVCMVPTRVSALNRRGSCRASCGNNTTFICTERGSVYAFGHNVDNKLGFGQLGEEEMGSNMESDNICNPIYMKTLDGAAVRQVVCGDAHTVVLTEYYQSDAVPERVDTGGDLIYEDQVLTIHSLFTSIN